MVGNVCVHVGRDGCTKQFMEYCVESSRHSVIPLAGMDVGTQGLGTKLLNVNLACTILTTSNSVL